MSLYLSIGAIILGIVLLLTFRKSEKGHRRGNLDRNFVDRKWGEVEELMTQGRPSAYKTAIIEADKLIDYVLKSKISENGTMGDRLKKARKFFSNYQDYNDLWYSHKTRNRLAHEADFDLPAFEAQRVIANFKKALRSLGLL